MAFNFYHVQLLVLLMVADGMQVMTNNKSPIYSFQFRHNLTVGFVSHCAQYGHYFIRQLSAATCRLFSVLTWPSPLTAHWCDEVLTESDERYLWFKIISTALIYVCVWALLTVCSFIEHKRANGFVI